MDPLATPGTMEVTGERTRSLTMKICLAGDSAVGKTSLLHRFVSNTFDDRYVVTLGAKVSSKTYPVEDPTQPGLTRTVIASLWDIMGQTGFRELFAEAYFVHAQAALLVCDSTRPETLHSLPAWFNAVRAVAGPVPAVVLVNKWDLGDGIRVKGRELDGLCAPRGWPWISTSAKTGENVEKAFALAAQLYLLKLRDTRAEAEARTASSASS